MAFVSQVILILPIILASANFCFAGLNVTLEWNYIDYVWKTHNQKAEAVDSGVYDLTKIIPTDIQPLQDGRVVITTPRYYNNPASVSTISNEIGTGGLLLDPYPDWSWHSQKDCSGITSVNKMILDDYNRLWLVDSGKIGNEQVCSAKILAFDAITDELLIEVEIPNDLSHSARNKSRGLLELLAVDTSCKDTRVYISDLEGYGFVIWDGSDIWRLSSDAFYPDPDQTAFTIDGVNFTMWDGPSNHGPITPHGYLEEPALLFKSSSSVGAYAISLRDLANSKSGSNVTIYMSTYIKPDQELSRDFTKRGGVLVGGFASGFLVCWNVQNPLETAATAYLETNATIYDFPVAIKMSEDPKSGSETVWVLANRYEHFSTQTMDWDQTNFRVMTGDIDTLVSGTVCEPNSTHTVEKSIVDKDFEIYEVSSNALEKIYPSHH